MDQPDLQRAAIFACFLDLVHCSAGPIAAIVPEPATLAGRPIGVVSMFWAPRVLLAGPGRTVLGEQGAHGCRAEGLADHRQIDVAGLHRGDLIFLSSDSFPIAFAALRTKSLYSDIVSGPFAIQ